MGSTQPRVAPTAGQDVGTVRHSPARTRVLDAALDLFAQHGVSGTSFQMIADAVGITKAAVYHQFRTKHHIVIAVTEREFAQFIPALEEAEARDKGPKARDALLVDVIEKAVRDRRLARTLQFDPVVVAILAEHEPFKRFTTRLYEALLGGAEDDRRVEAAMLSGALASAVMHPLVTDIDDDTLRIKVTNISRRLLGLPHTDAPPN